MDCSQPSSYVYRIFQQEYWSILPVPPPGDLPDPGIEHKSPVSPALAGGFLTTVLPWETEGSKLSKVVFFCRVSLSGLSMAGGSLVPMLVS